MKYIIISMLFMGCGMKIKPDFEEMEKYFYSWCKDKHPTYTEQQLQECTNIEIAKLLKD